MVKSKKMSKTGIAVIVLAILLVLSMIMGLTGAWYTAGASTSNAGESAHTFVLNDFVTISASGSEESSITAYTQKDLNSDGDFEDSGERIAVSAVSGSYYLFPEDEIEVVAGGEYKISAAQQSTDSNNVDFWYKVIVTGTATDTTLANGASSGSVIHYVHGTSSAELVSFRTVPVVSDSQSVLESTSVSRDASTGKYTYKVSSSMKVSDAGKSFTIAISGAGIEIRAIQYNNISATEAEYMLSDDVWNSGNPSAKSASTAG